MDHLEYTELTRHVMSFGSEWAERTTPEHIFPMLHPQQVGKVRVPAGKLFDGHAPFCAVDLSAQPTRQSHEIELFAGTNGGGVGL